MYCSRPVQRSPNAIRIISQAPRRSASYLSGFPTASISPFYTRPAATFNPFAGFERLLEDITSPQFPFAPAQITRQAAYQPRFDVRENEGNYELRGEVPGIEAKDIEVEFSDAQTLVVRGRTESESTGAQASETEKASTDATKAEAEADAAIDNSDAASVSSTGSYQKPSVEDATEPATNADTTTAASTEARNTPATTPGAGQEQTVAAAPKQQQQSQSHTWISERRSGSFVRVFKFPGRVDQEAVSASLKNGILSVVVPKAARPEVRRIQVE